jgi:hypothetical protein
MPLLRINKSRRLSLGTETLGTSFNYTDKAIHSFIHLANHVAAAVEPSALQASPGRMTDALDKNASAQIGISGSKEKESA